MPTPGRPGGSDPGKWVVGARFTSSFVPQPPSFENPLPARKGEPLADHVARCSRFLVVSRKADQLTARIRREKQFNRKVGLNRELKPLQAELRALSGA